LGAKAPQKSLTRWPLETSINGTTSSPFYAVVQALSEVRRMRILIAESLTYLALGRRFMVISIPLYTVTSFRRDRLWVTFSRGLLKRRYRKTQEVEDAQIPRFLFCSGISQKPLPACSVSLLSYSVSSCKLSVINSKRELPILAS